MTVSKTNTIIELEKAERYAEAGYGRLFAYDSTNFNAMIDARTKAKYIKGLNETTYNETQNELVYSGPTVFYDGSINIKHHHIDKMDIKSAYLAYLVNEKIKKPSVYRIKKNGTVPLSDKVVLYVVRFKCKKTNMFVKWFLNSSAIQKKKFKTDGNYISGEVAIFSSTWMNNLHYVNKFLSPDQAKVVKSYIFVGRNAVPVTMSQIHKLYEMKEYGIKKAKMMLVQSTGWLSLIDKPTYYHMVQYIKYHLLKTIYDYGIEDNIVGVQTDCLFFKSVDGIPETIMNNKVTVSGKESSIGTYTHKRVYHTEIETMKARVILKDV